MRMTKHMQPDPFQIKQNEKIIESTTPKMTHASLQQGSLTREKQVPVCVLCIMAILWSTGGLGLVNIKPPQ